MGSGWIRGIRSCQNKSYLVLNLHLKSQSVRRQTATCVVTPKKEYLNLYDYKIKTS